MRRGFTLIELMIVVAIIAVIAAIAIPNLMASRMASNESAAIAAMRTYLGAQNTFKRTDFYKKTPPQLVYANPSTDQGMGNGFPDLYQLGYGASATGLVHKLIDITFAQAHSDRTATTKKSKAGFHYDDLAYAAGMYTIDCGLCGAPYGYNRSGRNMYVIDVTGTVYQSDAAAVVTGLTTGARVTPITTYPTDLSKWIPVGSG